MALSDLGRNLRRFMKLKNISIQQLANDSDLGTATLSNILNNKTKPGLATTEKIANALSVSANELFQDVPKLKTLKYRTNKITAREIPELDYLQMNIAFWLQDYAKLEQQLNDTKEFSFNTININDPKEAAERVRQYFNDEFGIPENAPLVDLIQIIEKCGIKLYILPFGFKQTFGMSVGKIDNGPAIIVNNDSTLSTERKRFTIAHELGHIILHCKMYQDTEQTENDEMEKEADIFAAEVLMSTEAFIEQWNACTALNFVDTVLKVKQYFGVSYLTVLHRLCDITGRKDLYKEFCIKYKQQTGHDLKNHYEPYSDSCEIGALDNQPYSATNESYKIQQDIFRSTRFTNLVIRSYKEKIISDEEASRLLNTTIEDVKELTEETISLG